MKRAVAVLFTILGASLLSLMGSVPAPAAPPEAKAVTPAAQLKTATPIKHFLVLMQADHSFDNYFGTYPGADGIPTDTCMPDSTPGGTGCSRPFRLGGKAIVDLGHNAEVYREQYNNGKMDGFVSAFGGQGGVGNLAMGYYDDQDIPFYWNVADHFVLFDRLFTSAAGGSVWNHMFWVSGSPGNPDGDTLPTDGGSFDNVTTIFDRLQAAGISWKFYVQSYKPEITFRNPGTGDQAAQIVRVPLLNYNRFLDNPDLRRHIVDISEYAKDAESGKLPAVSFMVPAGSSEHPPGSIQAGESFTRTLLSALMRSSAWSSSAFMVTYDDWGGWYDHVKPPITDKYGYGFRSPALLVSPYAKKGFIDHTTLDFTSELKFIETNWDVAPLADRDAAANNITNAFDFGAPPRPPVLLDRTRTPPSPSNSPPYVVYGAYGLAMLVATVFVFAASSDRRWPTLVRLAREKLALVRRRVLP
jgi:phospholipase C